MCGIILPVTILWLSLHHIHARKLYTSKDIDVIVLAQEWPVAVCLLYKHEIYPGGRCHLPEQKNQWIVHGIWPRKLEGKYLEFCDDKWHLNPRNVEPIESELNKAQMVVYKEDKPYVFWSHEWLRHGTCAALFEPLNTQLKYFTKSIEWNQKYAIGDMLEAANIFPNDREYLDPQKIADAVKAKTGKDPMVGCYKIEGVSYLQEVRICMDKQFNVMDCKVPVIDDWCLSPKGVIYAASEWALYC
ncbi:hypothetical protein PYW07_002054 [Mythimna separata]|uniref:Uncharacterized protein n=1 Tax=Mythimna separata TaxID=271217 RepID=A0AAD7YN85_MYTSE|nr:hypothetical protein PYW07_002054 [Mythimna separata]